ncbi:MAG TPA: TIM barrel protein [Acidobacteriota bacterium]|nr:TIM barrel protein [Acidobacteriota bacterium]
MKTTGKLSEYALVGASHHSLYPCKHDPDLHLRTLSMILARTDIEVVDLTVPYGENRAKAIELIRSSGKMVVYNGYLMPTPLIPLGTTSRTEREQILMLARDQVDVASEAGARFFMQSVGADPGPEKRAEAFRGLAEYIWRLNDYMKRKNRDMAFLIELMDRYTHKKSLCGPTWEVVAFVEKLRGDVPDLGLVLDINHLVLMCEPFSEAFERCAPYLKHLHLGNCVIKDSNHPKWGAVHPPLGIEGGEIGHEELKELFRLLLKIGYLDKNNRRSMSLEITPLPGKTADQTLTDNLARLEAAWQEI